MDQTRKNQFTLFGSTLILGGASLWLHRYMMENCIDYKGLLISGSLPGKLLWGAGIAFVLILLLTLRTLGGKGSYADNFPRSIPGGLLMIAGGALLLTCARELHVEIPLVQLFPEYAALFDRLGLFPAGAAAFGMIAAGFFRLSGQKPSPILHALVCLYYIIQLLTSYRLWSADPQLQEYAYQHLALVLLMLCAFHRACCDANILHRKKLLFTAHSAAFCAIAACSGEYLPRMYLASALWALGCVCVPAVLPPDPEEDAQELAEAPEQTGGSA